MSDGPDLGVWYRGARERITALVQSPDVSPDLPVAATPKWTVRDVVAHVTGVTHDALTGNMAGAPGDEWTAAQVERCRHLSIGEMLEQWGQEAPLLEAFFSSPEGVTRAAGVFDVHTHEADLRNALGLPLELPADVVAWAGAAMRESFAAAVAEAGLPAVDLPINDMEWFRARLGRRTEAEVRAYVWGTDPTPYLDHFFIFGRADGPLGEAA